MSTGSVVSGEFVPGGKLLVHVAENGHSFEFDCDGSTPVEAIQRSVEPLCGVHVADQLLLCGNSSLHPQQTLSHYKLPHENCEIFLYNKARLLADAPSPPPEEITIPSAAIPPPPSPSQDPHPLDDASDPALKAMALYEKQFRYQFQVANAIYVSTSAKFEVCKRLLREQQVQDRALAMARSNLEHTYQKLQHRYAEFMKYYSQQHRSNSELLLNFEKDVERLRSVNLHPSLQSETRKCLLDFVKEDDLRKWFGICSDSHRQFAGKVSHLKSSFRELEKRAENVLLGLNSSGIKDLIPAIRSHQRILGSQKSIMQTLSKDVNTVKKHVDDCLNRQLSATIRPHDAVSALGPMYEAHKGNIHEVQTSDHAMAELLNKCVSKKNDMNMSVHVGMQTIKSVQFGIRDIMNELHAFQEVIGHQIKDFEHIKFVNGVGHAYRACLAEVVRRKSSLKLYMGLAGQLAEKLANEREAEIRKREGFFKAWSRYIPHDILASMGLFETPSQFDVNIAPFDTNLLEIDVSDVDRYAPKFSVGLLSKLERSESQKSSSARSDNKIEDSTLDTCSKDDSGELLETCQSTNIAGTCKEEVENARLKADLASAIALICMLDAEIGYDSLDEGKMDSLLNTMKKKTVEALNSKDEYGKHLQSMLDVAQCQCLSYEKRIQELEQRLSDQYMHGPMLSSGKCTSDSALLALNTDGYKPEVFRDEEVHMPYKSTVSMDEASCSFESMDPKFDQTIGQPSTTLEGGDENMTDLSGTLNMHDSAGITMDASMVEPFREDQQVGADNGQDQISDVNREVEAVTPRLSLTMTCHSDISTGDPLNLLPSGTAAELVSEPRGRNSLELELQNALDDKSKQCNEIENKLKAAMEEISSLRRDLEISRNLLDESQMNCAHLENCLHEAREEAHTNLCAADRKASEYNTARAAAVRMRSLFERFRSSITGSVGVAGFADSLRSLALALASSLNEDGDDGTVEFQTCVKVLADKVGLLARHRTELLDRYSRAEAANGRLMKEVEEKNEVITSLYNKHQLEKQANKERISFGRFEVHELAAFVLNSAGHYEAINRNCSNYFLSAESVSLFTEHRTCKPSYVIGQIVHIERQVVRLPGSTRVKHSDQTGPVNSGEQLSTGSGLHLNPYDLPAGCEYFVLTVAMLPDTIHSPSS